MNSQTIWYSTFHEIRTLRRLLRTHVFIWIALFISTVYFLVVTLTHMYDAGNIPMLGVISPRYVMSLLSGSFIALFCMGVLLLTFDQVKRDELTRIHEVMSSKPANNLEVFTGRLLGVSITIAIPMLFFLFSIVTYGMVADMFSLKFGEPVELWSVVSFVLLDIVPNFLFFGSLVILFSMLFRSRLLAILLTLCGLVALFWFNSRLPLDISRPLQTVSGNVVFPSELVPTLFTPVIVFNRIALLLMSIGLLYWASCLGTRISMTPSKDLVFGIVSFSLGLIVIGTMFGVQALEHNRINQWVEVHDEHFKPRSFPDVHKIRGSIDIKPGRMLSLDLTLDLSVDTNQDSNFVLFSLNPGYNISHLEVAGVKVDDHEFLRGLLKIPRHYFTSDKTELVIVAKGRPDKLFAYLDSRDTLSQIVGPDVRQLRQLGTENSIFHSKFVVLQPGIKWYPTSGTATNEDAWERRKRDFFTLDIEVSVPRNWLVAGPAKREALVDRKHSTYRFQQPSPLPEFALIGSRFESASIDIEGVSFEVLFSKTHQKTFETFARMEKNIRERVTQYVESVRDSVFDYPYGSLTLVEVPSTLRVFGGGISMDTVMCPPGMVMIRESTLPTIPVNSLIPKSLRRMYEQHIATEEDWLELEFESVVNYLQHPLFESNPSRGFFQSLLVQQTSATENTARAINTLLEHMNRILFPYTEVDFDFHLALDRSILNLASVEPLQILSPILSRRADDMSYEMQQKVQTILSAPEVWNYVDSLSLLDTEFGENRKLSGRAMRIRNQRLAQYLLDSVGRETFALVLADLSNRFRGRNFNFKEFTEIFAKHQVLLDELAGDMIGRARLPGFIGSILATHQLKSEDRPKYETIFLLQNGEPVSGAVNLSLTVRMNSYSSLNVSLKPILVTGNSSFQVTIESANPIQQIWVKPYLSQNRMHLRLDLPQSNQLQELDFNPNDQPFIKSIEEVVLEQDLNSSITIDDLDPEFSVVELGNTSTLVSKFSQFAHRFIGETEVPLDNGLPIFQLRNPQPNIWSRTSDLTAFGTYRRTVTISESGDGLAAAKFTATLPTAGEWKLEFYLPEGHVYEEVTYRGNTTASTSFLNVYVGATHLKVQNGPTTIAKTLDTRTLDPGWQTIGSFDLSNPVVDVLVSNKTENLFNKYVFADAIRWTPVEATE